MGAPRKCASIARFPRGVGNKGRHSERSGRLARFARSLAPLTRGSLAQSAGKPRRGSAEKDKRSAFLDEWLAEGGVVCAGDARSLRSLACGADAPRVGSNGGLRKIFPLPTFGNVAA